MAVLLALVVAAQTPGNRVIGVVTSIDPAARQITIKTDAGAEARIALEESASYLRVPPGEKDLKNAAKISLSDIGVGDRVLARGSQVIVMSKAELAKKHDADRAEWQRRGVSGVITAINPENKEITISVRTREGSKALVVPASGAVDIRRYAPDSVRFADARPSTFAELKTGDQVRALGTKSDDGSRLTPEFLVSGTFRNVAATVVSVDAAEKLLKVTDLDTKKPLTVGISTDSNLRKLQPMVANMLAMRLNGGQAGGGGDVEQMLNRQPALDLAELKPGDALIIASTAGADPNRITAITLLAGVEPILTSAPKGRQGMVLGNWNLDMGGAMGAPQ
jgi:Cu/Ag efflux protein CusF